MFNMILKIISWFRSITIFSFERVYSVQKVTFFYFFQHQILIKWFLKISEELFKYFVFKFIGKKMNFINNNMLDSSLVNDCDFF